MAYLILKHNGNAFAAISEGRLQDIATHVVNGFPQLIDLLNEITGEEVLDISGLVLSSPPSTDITDQQEFLRKLRKAFMALVNQERARHSLPPITVEQFRAWWIGL